jgi:predicted secreted protein
MANSAGRDLLIKKNSTTIASVTTKSVTWNGTPIETTNDDDDGAVSYLDDEFATTSLELTVEGLTDDDVLSDLAFGTGATVHSGKHLSDITLTRPNGDVISGNFILTNYVETGTSAEAVTFTATLVRNGIHTWTPSA